MPVRVVLALNLRTVAVERDDGSGYIREAGRPERPAPWDWPTLRRRLVEGGWYRVVGAGGEFDPVLPDGVYVPRLAPRTLPSGEDVLVVVPEAEAEPSAAADRGGIS